MSEAKNVDDIIVQSINEQQGIVDNTTQKEPIQIDNRNDESQEKQSPTEEEEPKYQEAAKDESAIVENKSKEEPKSESKESPIDEYGNPVEKSRLYTEEEVQQK